MVCSRRCRDRWRNRAYHPAQVTLGQSEGELWSLAERTARAGTGWVAFRPDLTKRRVEPAPTAPAALPRAFVAAAPGALAERLCSLDDVGALLAVTTRLADHLGQRLTDRIGNAKAQAVLTNATLLTAKLAAGALALEEAATATAALAAETASILAAYPVSVQSQGFADAVLAFSRTVAALEAQPTCRRKTARTILWIALPLAALGLGLILWKSR